MTFEFPPVSTVVAIFQILRSQKMKWTGTEFQNLLSPEVAPVEKKPVVRILEQPASHKLRFRYKCEGRGAGALQGMRDPEPKPDQRMLAAIVENAGVIVTLKATGPSAEVAAIRADFISLANSIGVR